MTIPPHFGRILVKTVFLFKARNFCPFLALDFSVSENNQKSVRTIIQQWIEADFDTTRI